jgi:hypothetical protein
MKQFKKQATTYVLLHLRTLRLVTEISHTLREYLNRTYLVSVIMTGVP